MGGGAARRHDRDANPSLVAFRIGVVLGVLNALDVVDLFQEGRQWAPGQRHVGQSTFVLLVRLQRSLLIESLGRVVGQNAVEVEGDAQVGASVVRHRAPHDAAGREPHADRLADVVLVGREEQGHAQRLHEAVGGAALHEDRARDVQPVVLNRAHDAHSRLGVVARQDDHLDQALVLGEVVEVQEAPNKGEGDPRF